MTSALRTSLILVAAAFMVGSTAAAELTLDDCIDLAMKNRAVIIQSQGAEKLAAAGKRSALGAFLPNLSASYGYADNLNSSAKGDELAAKFAWNVTPIPSYFEYRAAAADLAAARLDVIGSEQDLILAVKLAYFNYLAAVQNVTVNDQALKRAEEQLKLIQSRFDLGSASLSDVLKQKVEYGNVKLTLLKAQNLVTTTQAKLAYTIGIDPRQEQAFSSTFAPRTYDGAMDDAVAFALEHKPELLSAQKSLESAGYTVKSTMTTYFPELSFSLNAGRSWFSDKNFGAFGGDNDISNEGSVGYGLTWNIFDGFSREARVASAKVSRNNQRAGLADLRNRIVFDVKTAFTDIQQFRDQHSVAQENVTASEEDLKITQEKYNLGAATILDLLNAQVSLRQAQVDLIQADFDLNLAISRLENAMGKM